MFKVLTWGVPCRWLKGVLLYMIGSLGCSVVDAVEHVLSRELELLSDSIVESHCKRGLPATTSCSVMGGVSANGGAEGTLSSSGGH